MKRNLVSRWLILATLVTMLAVFLLPGVSMATFMDNAEGNIIRSFPKEIYKKIASVFTASLYPGRLLVFE